MTEPERGGSERLVMFTDAVVAIALTLLILPLLETISDVADETAAEVVRGHLGQFGAFALSFGIISRMWWGHHRLFGHIATLSPLLIRWNTLWTFGVVFLPIPTALITAVYPSATSIALYGGTLMLTSGSLAMLALTAHRHPEVSAGRPPVTREDVLRGAAIFAGEGLATVVGCLFAGTVGFWAFLLMLLVSPIQGAVRARWRKAGQPVP